jgi:hypothetical protein
LIYNIVIENNLSNSIIFSLIIGTTILYLTILSENNNKTDPITETQTKAERIGETFERHIVNMLNPHYFDIVEWTTDLSNKHHRQVESDMYPDLTVRYKPTGEQFAIECKFRSRLYNGMLHWTNDTQRARYLEFALRRNIPVFIVIGLGGTPDNPRSIYCLPLIEAKYSQLYPSVYKKYYHNPKHNLYWDGDKETLR